MKTEDQTYPGKIGDGILTENKDEGVMYGYDRGNSMRKCSFQLNDDPEDYKVSAQAIQNFEQSGFLRKRKASSD